MPSPHGKLLALTTAALALAVLVVAAWLSWPHLRFWWLFEPLGKNAQGYPEYRHRQTGIVMVLVPGGTFWMGAQNADPNGRNYYPAVAEEEGPVHEVTLSPFLIGKHEVTKEQWHRIIGDERGEGLADERVPAAASRIGCLFFCMRTNLRLPTEAQWEYACRGGAEVLQSGTGSVQRTAEQGCVCRNRYGLCHLQGNIWEHCSDMFSPGYYARCPPDDPENCEEGYGGTARGWSNTSRTYACVNRSGFTAAHKDGRIGFRVAWPVRPSRR